MGKDGDGHGIKGLVSWFKGKGDQLIKGATPGEVTAKYEFGRKVGSGGYADTFIVFDKKTKQKFACKSIDKKKVAADEQERLQIEVDNLFKLGQNPHIATLFEAFEDKHKVHLVMELCEGGELFDRILQRKHYSEKAAAMVVKTILEVVQFCHESGVAHRDLKPENFLFVDSKFIEEGGQLKSIDFGFSTEFKSDTLMTEILGSSYYVAPEVLKGKYNEKCDIWSVGVIAYILLTGQPPPWHCTMTKINRHITAVHSGPPDNFLSDPALRKISATAKEFVGKMIEVDFTKRATAREMLSHPWVGKISEVSDDPLDFQILHSLKKFMYSYRMKKKALVTLAEQLSDADIHDLRATFDAIDTAHDGVITFEELKVALEKKSDGCGRHKVAEAEVRAAMEEMDVAGDGVIHFHEFVAASLNRNVLMRRDLLHRVFDKFDTDHTGYLSKENIAQVMGSSEKVDKIMDEIDSDHDGKVNFEDFLLLMTRHDPELVESYGLKERARSSGQL
jgi:calcium-dependent protein kinase